MHFEEMETALVQTNGTELSVHSAGTGDAVVLCHGFPELAYWRHQVGPLVEAGYRVIVPDMPGFGDSARPEEVERYDVVTLSTDLVGVLDAFDIDEAVFVGHDWGAAICWQLALIFPERVRAVAGLSVPFPHRAPAPPVPILRKRLGEDFYMVWFQEPGAADAALARDVRRTLTANEVWTSEWADEDPAPIRTPFWMTAEDLEVYVETFERTGFTGGLNYYRNLDRNWELMGQFGERVTQPSMFLTGSKDSVRKFMPGSELEKWLEDLRANVVIEGAGHWIQQERPREVNAALLEFLAGIEN